MQGLREVLSSHSGRDKVHKVVHYGARFLGASRLQALMGRARRVGRLAGLLDALPQLLEARGVLQRLAAASDVGYYLADNLPLLGEVGITFGTSASLRAWMEDVLGTYSWLLGSLIYLHFAYQAHRKRPTRRNRLLVLALLMDLLLCFYFIAPGRPFSSRAAGLFGMANGLCSIAAALSKEE